MPFQSIFRPSWSTTLQKEPEVTTDTPEAQNEKDNVVVSTADDGRDVAVEANAQHGVQAVQAITQVWTTKALITAYVL